MPVINEVKFCNVPMLESFGSFMIGEDQKKFLPQLVPGPTTKMTGLQ